MTAEQRAFLDMAVPLAQKEARRAGILASLTLAQAIVESTGAVHIGHWWT